MPNAVVKKKVRKKLQPRHKLTASVYRAWMDQHPKASKERKFKRFDEIADEVFGEMNG